MFCKKHTLVRNVQPGQVSYYLCGHFAIVYPTNCGEVGGLCAVKPVIESSVVTIREGDHELASFLSNLTIYHKEVHEKWFVGTKG